MNAGIRSHGRSDVAGVNQKEHCQRQDENVHNRH